MSVYLVARVFGGYRNSLVLTGQCLEERCYILNFCFSEFHTTLIQSHVTDSFLKCLTSTIVIIWPCVLDVSKSRHLKTMTVTLQLCLLEATIVLISKFKTAICEIMTSESHQLI